ncbi:hypothetical protein LOCC1_G006692 [Lachnellula occidentalis]|uniref:Aminoglycoside phosphotransferase domain-containing protein n=1 Tax=Lachnellula occidentalis TaxID=215460 RepID=A0A8H8RSN4_9HELO|nr:hypothetical protein LOCC1_G006692 [Lachnellula occidentalis]
MSPEQGVFSYAKFNLSALLHLAGQLRGTLCSCDEFQRPESGALNWAIVLWFEDGVEWIFRSPQRCHDISPETTARLLESEVATMKYVKLNSSIPVPQVFDHSCTGSNTIGIPFILMSKAPGYALSQFSWNARLEGMVSSRKPLPCLERANKEKIMKQLGVISSQLLNLRFDKMGSLFEEDGEYRIKKCLSPALVWHERDSLDDVPRGPFQHTHDYYESQLSAFLLHVKELPLDTHAFFAPIPELGEFETVLSYRSAVDRWNDFVTVGSKIDSSKNRLDYCVAGHFLRQMIPLITQQPFVTSGDFEDGYPLSHPDISTSNIFVDSDFNITCVIDWAFSSTVPISTLLVTPSLPHPRDEVDTTLVPTFRASFMDHFLQEKDIKLSPKFWDSTRRAWLFSRLVTLDSLQDYRYFTELYMSVYKPEDDIDVPRLFKDVQREEGFVELGTTLAEDDRSADKIQKDEEEYFHYSRSEKEAIARKLTMVAGLSEGFVADKRLWQWIEGVIA